MEVQLLFNGDKYLFSGWHDRGKYKESCLKLKRINGRFIKNELKANIHFSQFNHDNVFYFYWNNLSQELDKALFDFEGKYYSNIESNYFTTDDGLSKRQSILIIKKEIVKFIKSFNKLQAFV